MRTQMMARWAGVFLLALAAPARAAGNDDRLAPQVVLPEPEEAILRGSVVDAQTGERLPARIYIQDREGRWYFARSSDRKGMAVPYQKKNGASEEMHTTVSAHPFVVSLKPGSYRITIEHGKEYLPYFAELEVRSAGAALEREFRLRRWIDMGARGWFSGETHVHRSLDELPTAMLAEDLNVAFPLTYWVTKASTPPQAGDKNSGVAAEPKLIQVDSEHVIYPRNTEFEIFTVGEKKHTLGAVFILNHKSVIDRGVPPVKPVAERAHKDGALIELDKHAWEWSMMLVPVMKVDLYELANNHMWRSEFMFRNWGVAAPEYMKLEPGGSEWAWMDYGFQNYYALLDCGFHLAPTAGTASGVHPVPLGFGRVYVHLKNGFQFDSWLQGLRSGNSFVTTGPMLFAEVDGEDPGATIQSRKATAVRVSGQVESIHPLRRIQVVRNGEVVREISPDNHKKGDHYRSTFSEKIPFVDSGWVVVRCFESEPDGRLRFAHTAPWNVSVAGKPLVPRKAEVQFLIQRVKDQIERNEPVLSPESLVEYRNALDFYEMLAKSAR